MLLSTICLYLRDEVGWVVETRGAPSQYLGIYRDHKVHRTCPTLTMYVYMSGNEIIAHFGARGDEGRPGVRLFDPAKPNFFQRLTDFIESEFTRVYPGYLGSHAKC